MLDTKRLKFGHPKDYTPSNIFSDFDWLRRHEKELLAQYGECSIIIYKEQVLGVGATIEESVQNAEANLTPDAGEITPIQDWLVYPNPFLRIQPTPKPHQNGGE